MESRKSKIGRARAIRKAIRRMPIGCKPRSEREKLWDDHLLLLEQIFPAREDLLVEICRLQRITPFRYFSEELEQFEFYDWTKAFLRRCKNMSKHEWRQTKERHRKSLWW